MIYEIIRTLFKLRFQRNYLKQLELLQNERDNYLERIKLHLFPSESEDEKRMKSLDLKIEDLINKLTEPRNRI